MKPSKYLSKIGTFDGAGFWKNAYAHQRGKLLKKVNVPDDVAVVGYDNIAVSAYTTPSLTTVQQNTKLAGELLVNTLLKAINNEDVQDYLMPADIIIRQSCGSE